MAGADKTMRKTIEDAYDYHNALVEESDRGAAVLAASRFEEFLRVAISKRLIDLNEKDQKTIFGPRGLLSGFYRRTNIAYAFGYYDRDTLSGLDIIRRIRDRFAHSIEPMGFDHPYITNQCRNLVTRSVDDSRERYLAYLRETEEEVRRKMLSG